MTPRSERYLAGEAASGPADSFTVRAVAVGNRISVRAARTERSFVAELERIVGMAAPHLSADGPNLLVLAELLGLPAALCGLRAWPARQARTSESALTLLALAYLPRVLRARRRWKGISLARALLLARADALYRPFVEALSRLAKQHRTHIVATTIAPRIRFSRRVFDALRWGGISARGVYLADGPEVYNAALVFGPDGALLGRVDKVNLTSSEVETLDLTPGRMEDVRVIRTSAGRLGVAISLDAFTPDFCQHLNAQHAEIVVQPDANDMPWAGASARNNWQPAEWLGSVLGSIQPAYPNLRYNICAMQTGNFFDVTFDGQSSITSKSDTPPDPRDRERTFVGIDAYVHADTGEPLLGTMLAVSPWVAPDPVVAEPDLRLEERRARLAAEGRELLPGGRRANQHRESVIWADLSVRNA